MLKWAGVYFGENETYRIYKSIIKLAKMTGAKSLRFWGKILGSKHDYFIAEGILGEAEELELPPNYEPRGQGVNKYVYWATDNILSDWVQLPDSDPDHIKAARRFKHILTGDLNGEVLSNPPFPGKERHFLRSQIARIAHATTLAPKGLLEPNEEQEGEMIYSEEFSMPALEELNNTESWVHHYPNILNAGRITHMKPNVPEDQLDEEMAKLEEEDKILEKLMGINEDQPIPPLESAWLMKIVGDDQPYNPDGEEEGTAVYAAHVIKSLRWPGAYTVSYSGNYVNIYVGYGLKFGDVSYNPTMPPDVVEDPDEKPEQPEPTPLEAPEEPLEPDTDEEKKPEGEED
jgi:radial spoke head protein 4/6